MTIDHTLIPKKVELSSDKNILTLTYADDNPIDLSAEFLRVYSPSAEVKGHGIGNEVLQTGKRSVRIFNIEQVGNYALKFTFSDGHDSGIYDWKTLKNLAENLNQYWDDYLIKLQSAGKSRGA